MSAPNGTAAVILVEPDSTPRPLTTDALAELRNSAV